MLSDPSMAMGSARRQSYVISPVSHPVCAVHLVIMYLVVVYLTAVRLVAVYLLVTHQTGQLMGY